MKITNQTRFKFSITTVVFLAIVVILSIVRPTENIGVTAIAGIMTVLSSYIWAETKRPSN